MAWFESASDVKGIIEDNRIGLWIVEHEEGMATRFYADAFMDELLGISHESTPEDRYLFHHNSIHPDDLGLFEEYEQKLCICPTEIVYRYNHPEKGERFVRCSGVLDFSEKEITRIRGTHQDISDIIRLEKDKLAEARLAAAVAAKDAALERAQRASAAKTEFLSRMSHDIRTPLNGIIGIMDINDKHSEDYELVVANRKKARVAAEHLLSLINDILDMSKLEDDSLELVREPMNLFEEFADVVTIINLKAKERGVTVEHDGGPNIIHPDVFGSKLHFKQLMMNILSNCVKYNRIGGKIYGNTELISKTDNQVVYKFVISDTGIGMSQDFIDHIFEPFTQEKNDARSRYQGTGMGMAIVKKLVDKMGGSIEVESQVGVGSKFSITLPFEINYYPEAEKDTKTADEAIIRGKNILLAEDNDLNADIVRYVLEDFGATVVHAKNGQEAFDLYNDDSPGTFDAVLMDIMMPVLDGYDATELIRKSKKADADTIPIIALSANAFAEDVRKAKSYGMNDHLSKPLDVKKLVSTLGKYFS